jgi:hypothetical protein
MKIQISCLQITAKRTNIPSEDKKFPLEETAKAQNKNHESRIYMKTCGNIKKDLHFQLIEDTIVLYKDKYYHPSISTAQGNQVVYQLPPAP